MPRDQQRACHGRGRRLAPVPQSGDPAVADRRARLANASEDDDPTDAERRHQPELSLTQPVESRPPIANEFEIDGDQNDEGDELPARNRALTGIMQSVAGQASLDFGDGMEI